MTKSVIFNNLIILLWKEDIKMPVKGMPRVQNGTIYTEIQQRTGLQKVVIKSVMEAFFDVVKECVINGFEVQLKNFGLFTWRHFPPRKNVPGYNYKTNEFVIIDESPGFYVPFFKPHKKWKDITKGTTKYHTEEWIKEHEHGEEHQQRIDK